MARDKVVRDVVIEEMAAEGKALARIGEVVTFVEGVVPGDVVDVLITKKRKNYWEGRPYRFVSYSEKRADARCCYFGVCGGCKWQHLDYADQLAFKEKQVKDALQRIGKVSVGEWLPIMGSQEVFHYRNRLDFSFADKRWLTREEVESGTDIAERPALGFHVPGRWDKVLDVEECHLQPEPSNAIRNRVRELAMGHNIPFFDPVSQKGHLRNLTLRNTTTGQWMLLLSVGSDSPKWRDAVLGPIVREFPQLTSVMYVVNTKANDTIYDLDIKVYAGQDHIMEEMEGLRFKIGPKSFFQTNGKQAEELYKVARDLAGLTGNETVYDLYTGTGTIALYVSKKAKKVVGIEQVEAAIEDAKLNASLNGIGHASFHAGDMKDIFTPEFIAREGRPDVIITDPPRAGMHGDVVHRLLELAVPRIVYVSCNPATQARDLQLLSAQYDVVKVRPVDMFPHTHHVENVALLELRAL
ncbi:MAG: 23S rRNA (uracil(1939)-C(5))-methyltransferase RlmD [Flavobacteriales bacterium]|nr:23S rRNA (uracil(1939)-C(5))-methyltransferase RlmD [Flavobacteriales bacterium]